MPRRVLIERLIVIVLIAVGIVVSMAQTIVDIGATPGGTVFPLVHNYAEDYYLYLHLIRQGMEGAWAATSWMSPEINSPQVVNVWFLLMGHVARIFNSSLPLVYTIGRVTGGLFLYLVIYKLIKSVYPTSLIRRTTALVLVVFGGFWWGWQDAWPTVPVLTHIWTELDPMVRMSYVPHHLWAKGFMVVTFLLLLRMKEKRFLWGYLLVAVSTGLMGFASPVTIATFLPTIMVWFVWEARAGNKRLFVPWGIALSVAIAVALYHRSVETGVFPWNSYKPWEDSVRFPITIATYLQSLGPNFLLFLVGLALGANLKHRSFLVSWAASGFLMALVLGRFLPISNIRFLEGYQWIPMSIVASEGLVRITDIVTRVIRRSRMIVWSFLVVVVVGYAGVGFWASMREHLQYLAHDLGDPRVYVSKTKMEAIGYLDANTPNESVVLGPYHWMTMIPALAGNRVLAGHQLFTFEYSKKMGEVERFYQSASRVEMEAILRKYRVSVVVGDPPTNGVAILVGSGVLSPMWHKDAVTLYRVITQ